jgi:MipA family protein
MRRVLRLIAMVVAIPNLYGVSAVVSAKDGALDGYLGIGLWSTADYTGSAQNHFWLAPIARFDYDDFLYVYINRAGVRLWSNDDQTLAFGFSAEPRFGFHAKDGLLLTGMQTRHDAIEGGPTLEWEFPQVSVSVAYYTDVSDTSNGQALHVSLFRSLIDRHPWDVGLYVDFEHLSSKITQYYFGVPPAEATASRPAYQPNDAVNATLGLTGAYRLDKHHALLFGGEANRLGDAVADSPIVRGRIGLMAYFGVGLAF